MAVAASLQSERSGHDTTRERLQNARFVGKSSRQWNVRDLQPEGLMSMVESAFSRCSTRFSSPDLPWICSMAIMLMKVTVNDGDNSRGLWVCSKQYHNLTIEQRGSGVGRFEWFQVKLLQAAVNLSDTRLRNDTGRALREIAMSQFEDYVQAHHLSCIGACSSARAHNNLANPAQFVKSTDRSFWHTK